MADDNIAEALRRIEARRSSQETTLDLQALRLAELPATLFDLTALTELALSGNRLTALPPEIGTLSALTNLDVSHNRLTALPPEIGTLTALTSLWVSANRLTALPPEIGTLTALTGLNTDGNTLVDPPQRIAESGTAAVKRYFSFKERQQRGAWVIAGSRLASRRVFGRLSPMSVFKRRRFLAEIILLCVRWYCRYGISYRDLEEMMGERGVAVDHVTLYRWVQRYAPELEKRVRWYQGYRSSSWRVDETYVRVGGKWKYLFRAVDKQGRLIDRRNTKAARRFLSKALKVMRNWPPVSITTDKLGSYPKALRRLKREGELKDTVRHRTSKYLNNRIEADHGALKRLIRPTRGFQSMKTAYATIKGFEIMRMIRRRHCILIEPGVTGEVRFVNKLFDLAA